MQVQARSVENIRSNVMKGHYFTKLVTEQRRLGGTSWRKVLRISTPGKRISSNQNGHVFVMVGQGKLGTRNGEAKLKYKATENCNPNIFSIYKKGT